LFIVFIAEQIYLFYALDTQKNEKILQKTPYSTKS